MGDSGDRIEPPQSAQKGWGTLGEMWDWLPIAAGVVVGGSIAQVFDYKSFWARALVTSACCGFFGALSAPVEWLFHRLFSAKK